jgi:hypothetical protein
MILIFVYDHQDKFVCTMNFKDEYKFNEFVSNASFDTPVNFEVIDCEDEGETLQ